MTVNIPIEPMSYKQQINLNQEQELITKLRIIRAVKLSHRNHLQTACQFRCHRNTVGNIIREFNFLSEEIQQVLLYCQHLDQSTITDMLKPLANRSTKPHHHPSQPDKEVENKVVDIFKEGLKYGPARMQTTLCRRYQDSSDPIEQAVVNLSERSIRGIFNRNNLQLNSVTTVSGKRQSLYEYDKIGCFEYMHYDVKHVLDQKALPPNIYYQFANNKELPLYQWTFQEVKSRTRFLAYSRSYNAEFGLKFLLFSLSFIRTYLCNWDQHITIGLDNGVEFCAGSTAKESLWNQILTPFNSHIYSYHAGHDIRKNLIERSHRTDDRELYVPRGERMTNLTGFMREARNYFHYFNFQRVHTGIGMNKRTPAEVLLHNGVTGVAKLMQFPVIVLEDEVKTLREMTDQFLLYADIQQKQNDLKANKVKTKSNKSLDQKTLLDLCLKYDFFDSKFAQKVLTYYRWGKNW